MEHIDVRQRLRSDLPWIAGFSILAVSGAYVSLVGWGADSQAYWQAARGPTYTTGPNTAGAYLYSPAFLQAIRPLAALPWPAFGYFWSALAGLALAALLAPLGWRRGIPLWMCCSWEITSGNIFWLFAVVAAFGLRFPALWALPALTKITPAIGPLWFAMRGEWSQLSIAMTATLGLGVLSFVQEPVLWHEWIAFLSAHLGQATGQVGGVSLPLIVRLPLSLLLVAWGARSSRPWTIVVAMVIASPVSGIGGIAILAALPWLRKVNDSGECKSVA